MSFWPSPSLKKDVVHGTVAHLMSSYEDDCYHLGGDAHEKVIMNDLAYESKMEWLPDYYRRNKPYSFKEYNCCRIVIDALEEISGVRMRGPKFLHSNPVDTFFFVQRVAGISPWFMV